MAKFARRGVRPAVTSPVTAVARDAVTHEGAPAYSRTAKSDLFLLAVTNMVGEDTFYEGASERDARFRALVHQVAVEDPEWMARFIPYLRGNMNMRSASVVAAAETVHAWLATSMVSPSGASTRLVLPEGVTARRLVCSAIQRADEPGEFLAYWMSRYGRHVPMPVKRGVGDALTIMLSEYEAMKYDGVGRAWRLGDVVELAHPKPCSERQSDLFRYLLDRRHHAGEIRVGLERLPMVQFRQWLESVPAQERRSVLRANGAGPDGALKRAGASWEWLSGWLPGGMDAEAWSWVIPSMGYMALLRNLRNFDQAGVPDDVAAQVCAVLADPERVARSRQFPFRFWSAYTAAPSLRWKWALEQALDASCSNIPELPGRSLVLVDTSASMTTIQHGSRSKVTPAVAAAVFGVALARRCQTVDLVGFASGTFVHRLQPGGSVLPQVEAFLGRNGEVGHGTEIELAMSRWSGHDRVFLFSDMQTMGRCRGWDRVPETVPVYGFNLAGYAPAYVAGGQPNRHELGGLSDAAFTMVPLLERGTSAGWPF